MYSMMCGFGINASIDGLLFLAIPGDEEMTMDMILLDSTWNMPILHNLFGKELVNVILQIQIMPNMEEDRLKLIH